MSSSSTAYRPRISEEQDGYRRHSISCPVSSARAKQHAFAPGGALQSASSMRRAARGRKAWPPQCCGYRTACPHHCRSFPRQRAHGAAAAGSCCSCATDRRPGCAYASAAAQHPCLQYAAHIRRHRYQFELAGTTACLLCLAPLHLSQPPVSLSESPHVLDTLPHCQRPSNLTVFFVCVRF